MSQKTAVSKAQELQHIKDLLDSFNRKYSENWELKDCKDWANVLLSEADELPGREISEVLELVTCSANIATHSQSFLHFMENEAGARDQANKLLQKKADALGAHAVVGIRYNEQMHTLGSNTETCSYFTLITAYGTAVRLK